MLWIPGTQSRYVGQMKEITGLVTHGKLTDGLDLFRKLPPLEQDRLTLLKISVYQILNSMNSSPPIIVLILINSMQPYITSKPAKKFFPLKISSQMR